ncbi:serine/threonine protein kinase [Microbulbifer flavimaris]|uniref:Stress response kinase A n=1 Tax=Microbulbifer flavimaris TaxID=1781068 RepID=A0ABX4HXZ5_9GAMM|nr:MULTISPECIES: serine/threonine protein kinase [Microbulbifer]KUJ82834.1 serine/threonine protein kinase [Microbulbifer sp. ZGT114]PCO05010.1 serine/threonine protein kinase [Microbulbifer flavimaris]
MSDSHHPYEALTPDMVIDCVESVGLWSDARIFPLNSYENRVYQVGIEGAEPLIAKFYRPGRWTDAQILEEHAFTRELVEAEIPVVGPLAFHGKTLMEHGGFRFAVFPRRGGRQLELDNFDHLEQVGTMLGRIHAVGASRPFEHRPALTLQHFAIDSREFILSGDFLPRENRLAYESVTADIIDRVAPLFEQPWRQLRLHGDCHAGNFLWRDETPWFVDLDDCLTGPAIQDIWMLISGSRAEQTAYLDAVIEGYETFSPFDPRELQLVEPLRCLRQLHHAAWLARRWQDPAFPLAFPWFNTPRYWAEHILALREQQAALQEPPLTLGAV